MLSMQIGALWARKEQSCFAVNCALILCPVRATRHMSIMSGEDSGENQLCLSEKGGSLTMIERW